MKPWAETDKNDRLSAVDDRTITSIAAAGSADSFTLQRQFTFDGFAAKELVGYKTVPIQWHLNANGHFFGVAIDDSGSDIDVHVVEPQRIQD